MLHSALSRALATAHVEDLHRSAAPRHEIRLARRAASPPTRSAESDRDRAIRRRGLLIAGLDLRGRQPGVRRK
jgi:hypothetical protein